jgi:hypothetical protein
MPRTDREELVILRISVARIAQALELLDPELSYHALNLKAAHEEKGWNFLTARIRDKIHSDKVNCPSCNDCLL